MQEKLLGLFAEHLEKQDMISKLTEHEKLHEFGYSEIHTIAAIGYLEEPNVTAIAEYLNMTKGAISKIIKKCLAIDAIEPYMKEGNNQKVFYRLKEKGEFLYKEHEKRHTLWKSRDLDFFSRYSEKQLVQIIEFMSEFNHYLEDRIEDLGGKHSC